jgi:hypothetical protein
MSLVRTIRKFCARTPPIPVWRQLLSIFLGQLLWLGFVGLGLVLQLRGVESVSYSAYAQPPRPTGGPWLLYLLGAGLMLLFLPYKRREFRA